MPVADSEFCVDGADECLTVGEDGTVAVEYPAGTAIAASVKAPGFVTSRIIVEAEEATVESIPVPLIAEGVFALLAENGGADVDADKGHVAFIGTIEGGGLTDSPDLKYPLKQTVGMRPVAKALYFRQGNIAELIAGDAYAADATSTTNAGVVNYYNMAPGSYVATIKGVDGCNSFFGEKDGETKVKFDVKAGEISYLGTICPAVAYFVAQNALDNSPVTDAEFCLEDEDECLKPDESGVFTLAYEFGTPVRGSVKSSGYVTARTSAVLRNNRKATPGGVPLLLEAVVETIATAGGVESLDETKGHVAFLATIAGMMETPNGKEGITMTIEPAIGGTGELFLKGGDVFQLLNDGENIYDDSATATTNSGAVNIFNAEPGEYTLTINGAEDCTTFFGVPGEDGSITFDVKPAEISYVNIFCP